MSANPIDDNTTPNTTGSLEELFRHHLGEEAAVPPRPMVWDQLDNSLLMRQNEVYRRRLVATRWVAAASLLLATLAGTSWWAGRDALLSGQGSVAASRPAGKAGQAVADGAKPGIRRLNSRQLLTSPAVAPTVAAHSPAAAAKYSAAESTTSFGNTTQNSGSDSGSFGATAPRIGAAFATQPSRNTNTAPVGTGEGSGAGRRFSSARNNRTVALASAGVIGAARAAAAPTLAGAGGGATPGSYSAAPMGNSASMTTNERPAASAPAAQAAAGLAPVDPLAARLAALNPLNAAALPNGLPAAALPEAPAEAPAAKRWHYGASYTAGVFNPNVNFSRAGISPEFDYNPALGAGSPALTEAAAAQYRENLRPGFSQRLALLATRHLTGNWSLSTGAEFTQATAKSATATSFVGEQLYDLGQPGTGPLHSTNFRYRLASIPLEVRYANPVKRGWSAYGRLGGVVSALLGVRSEVEDNHEATRTYAITSASTPYRRVLGSLRGAAGAQFRNATDKWAFTLGPVAEVGLTPLNAHPAQPLLAQSRAYSFGLEAGVEFGR